MSTWSIANANPTKLPGPQLLHHLIRLTGDDGRAALEHTSNHASRTIVSYPELHQRAELLAFHIAYKLERAATSGQRVIVPLLIPQCPDLYISQLATLKAGGAFCPIVLDAPEERLRFILRDIDARILLTTVAVRSQLPHLQGVEIIAVDDIDRSCISPGPLPSISPQDAAYIMYTSGSTGQPKGVILSHSAACQALLAHDLHIPHFQRFLQFASPTFDVSVFEIFFPLFRGSTLISCDRRRLLNDLPGAINQLHVDACELTPSVASSLLQGRQSVPNLRVLLTIGEMLKPSVVGDFGGDDSTPAILHGMYGPTEATIHCTLHTYFPKDMSCNSIGVPLETVSAFVVKATTGSESPEIVEIGEEGELAVGGHQLADGYLNREEQTKAAFVQHPQYGLLYRTGDRARMLPDGRFECLGRISSGQVKLRGQRIELGEIEHAASRTAGCRDVVAEVISNTLVAFCVRGSPETTESNILETCKKWLPAFMVPGEIVVLDSLPYLASGKCDRKALRAQYEERREVAKSSDAIQDQDLQKIMSALSHILGAELEPSSSLPAFGLDSISSIRLVSELRHRGLPQLDAGHVLTARTPIELLSAFQAFQEIDECHSSAQSAELSYREMLDQAIFEELSSETIEELELSFPCTPVQDAMLSETSKNPRAYCNWVELAVHQCADVAILTSAVEELSVSHPLLRSGFVSISGQSFGHAVLTWKSLKPQQIGECTSFDREFHIVNDRDLLRPLKVQIMRQGSGHRLLFRIHHALYDQWALDLLQRDLEAILKGQQLAPHPSFKNVSDYYYTHNEDSPDSTNHEFWRNYLRDVTTTPLPILRAQEVPARLTRSAWRETSVLISDVREHSRSIGCSSPALFQTALAYILGSYTGSSNVTFGSVFSGRHLPVSGIDSIFGPCLATLPCRVDHRSAHSCRDLLVAVTDGNRKLQQHLLTSPTTIRKAAGVAPSEALFDTVFIWQETAFDSENVGKHVEIVDSADELEFNLVLEFEPSDTYIRTRATYQQQLFDSSQIERLLGQLEHLVSKMMQDPNRSMDDVGAALPSTLLSIVNPQPQSYAGALDITAMVSSHAQRQPSAPAILFARSMDDHILDSQSITYAGLDARANAMAHLFIEAGMKPHDIICICMEKSIDLYVAMLASFKAGGGYLSLVPETPAARVKSMLEQANITLCVCDSEPAVTFRGLSEATIIDAGSLNLTTYSTESPPVVQDEARIAYLISTSGSTGEPKGVPVTMSNLKGNLAVLTELYQVSPEDRLLQSCSQAFDVNVFEIFFTFTTGMCLCSARKDVMFADLEHSIRTLRATHLIMTPTVASLVHPENVPSVRFLVAAGEGMTERVHSDWADKGLHNGYGPSEATNVCCVKMNIQKDDTLGNIGPPLKNTSAFVIDTGADFRVLPSGSYGEFAFGGEQVFPGYLNRDDLNAVKIVNHPEYGRIFRSGDMGRILHDGTLLFSGRLDDQVKIRGNRVELGEINAVILNHRDVSDCTTIVLGKNSAEQMLISFWVPISEESSNSTLAIADASSDLIVDLYERLEAALPVYMTPSFLVPVNRLPTTTQGKLDKRLLLSAFEQLSQDEKDRLSRSHETSSEDMPTSPTEQAIAKVLALVLNVQESSLSRNVSFFAVGMNSLNAIRFAKGLEKQFQSRLSITEILRNPSILRLARIIDAAPGDVPSTQLKDVRDIFDPEFVQSIRASFSQQGNEVVDVLPCTPLQEAMLSSTGTSDAYCNTTKLHFDGDMDKLRRCWDEMTRRHEILRTAFVDTPYAAHPYAQVVLRESTLPWTTTSLQKQSLTNGVNGHGNGQANGHTNGKVNGNACAHQKGASTHKPKLEGITPLQPVRVTECESFVYLQMHHAIYDGISVANLFSEIQSLYHGEQLPPAVSLLPFLGQVLSQNNQAAIDFWKPRVQDFQPRPFPQHNVSSSGLEGVHEQIIPISPSELGSFSERYSCTPLSVLQAAWTKTLATLQSASTVCFGNVVNGRSVPVPEIDRLVAPCFNTLPVITQLDRIRTNLDLVISLHRNNIESLEFQLTATRKLQALSKYPSLHLFDSLLLVQPPTEDVAMWSVEEDEMDMGIPLVVEVLPEDESFGLQLHYLSANVSESLAQHIADGFIAALQSCLQYPSSSVDNFLSFDVSRINRKLESAYVSPDSNIEPGHGTTDAPWDAEEATIRDVFADLAGIDSSRINQQTSLYRIGLDSLNAVQVAYRLRKSGFKLDAADVMQYQTPKALASFIKSRPKQIAQASHSVALDEMDKKYRQRALSSLGIANQHVESVWPCTPAQSGMLAQFVQSEGVHYFNHTIYEIPENCSLEIIEAAWRAVQRKHQVLRMGFCENDDAKMPFSMVLYTQEGVPQQLIVTAASPDENEVQTAAAQSVLRALHLPAWRVTFFGLEHWKMCLSIHHALYDAESLRVLLVDFSRALRGEDLGRPTDISAVVQNQLDGAHMGQDEAEAFWKASLASTQLIKFPNLTPTNVSTPGAGSKEVMSSLSVAKIEDFCRAQGVTMQAVGQSTWALLLAAYLGEPNVTFGTVFSGSNGSSAGAAAFPSISTLPVHCDTSRNIPEIVQDMVSYNAMAQRYRYTPLTDIQRFAGSPGQPLFDTIFVFQKSGSGGEDAVLDWKITNNTLGVDYVASMEIEVSLKGDLLLRLTHDIRSIPEAHADLILRQFDRLLGEAIGATAGEISKDLLSIVPPKEASIPCDVELLHEFLERGSRRHPEKPALEFIYNLEDGAESRKIWTYEELNQRCNQVAHLIQHSGVKPGSTVAVCMSKCPEATFAFAGILKAGCAFLAMDPDLPLARRQFIVEDSRSRLLFVDAKSNVELEDLVTTVKLTEDMLLPFPTSSINIPKVDPNATSYCLYTSGTTGTPKGCELSHENAVQAMLSFQRLFADHWTEDSRWLQFASYWFDVSVLEQFWSWSVGITCIGAPRDLVLEDLPGFIRAANITHIDLTPSLARLLKPEDVPSLHHNVFITGGEALKQEIIDAWGPLHTIYNGYGPTEATIGVTMNTHIGPEAKPSNIGPAFDNVGAFVFAPDTDEPVLRGAVGELCVSGKLVGKGYLNRPDLTAKAFPYLERHGERVYRTGDLVRLLADESFSFIGRKDTQAKLRGQRLEIEEIDSVIKASSDAIADVASLVTKPSEGGGEMLVSFVADMETVQSRDLDLSRTTHSSQLVASADQACRDRLPAYMVPTHIIPITRLPLTVNNKVDTKRLVALFTSLSSRDLQQLKGQHHASNRPLHAVEKKIAKVLARLLSLQTEDIVPSSNVFSLGLSSVSAIALASLLKREGFRNATVAKIMERPTVESLGKILSKDKDGNDGEERSSIMQAKLRISAFAQRYRLLATQSLSVAAADIESIAPCTSLQEGLLVESLKSSRRPYFNHFWYDGDRLDAQKLVGALDRLIALLPILRTSFIRTDEGFAQVVLREGFSTDVISSVEVGNTEEYLHKQKQEWADFVENDVLRPFEVHIARSGSRTVLAFHAHHALYDGISWDLTIDLLSRLYATGTSVDAGTSFHAALPYGPLCHRKDTESFWQARLDGFEFVPLELSPRSPSEKEVSLRVGLRSSHNVEAVRQKAGVSHQAILQAAFAIAIHQTSPRTQNYGVVLSGRAIALEGAESVVGPMFNTLPFTMDLDATDTWLDLLQRLQRANADVLPHQHTSLRTIRKSCGRHPSDPMFDVLFVFQRTADRKDDHSTVFTTVPTETPAEYPLAIELELEGSGNINMTLAAQAGTADEDLLLEFVRIFENVIECMGTNLGQKVTENFTISRASTSPASRAPAEDMSQLDGVEGFDWTPEALRLRELIAQVAQCDQESVTEHIAIFTLGLDSIDAVKLAARMKKAGLPIPVSVLLKAQTIPRILESLEARKGPTQERIPNSSLAGLEQKLQPLREAVQPGLALHVERVIPATPGQEALIADMLRSDFQEYFNSDILRLNDGVDVDRLKSAIQQVVDASPLLRTVFVEVSDPALDSVFVQVVQAPNALHFEEVTAADVDALTSYVSRVRDDVRQSFSQSSLLRLAIARVESSTYLILSLSHAQYDGHSIQLLHKDIADAYRSNFQQRPSYDSAIDSALNATNEDAIAFWSNTLAGAKPSSFGADTEANGSVTHRAELISSISGGEAKKACQSVGVSLQALSQASWALLVAHHTRQLEVLFGVVLACRDSEEAEQILFPTMNTVPMRASLHGTGRDMLQHIQNNFNDMRQFQRTPLRAIQSACKTQALFDSLFIYQNRGDSDQNQHPLYESVESNANVEYPVAVEVEVSGEDVIIRAACKNHVFDGAGTDQLLHRFDHILEFLVRSTDHTTIEFDGDQASICELPPFPTSVAASSAQTPREMEDLDEMDDASDDASPLIEAIRSALAQVSKLPVEDISSNTTINAIGVDSISAIKVVSLLRKQSIRLSVSNMLRAQTPKRMAGLVERAVSATSHASQPSAKETIASILSSIDVAGVLNAAGIDSRDVENVLPATAVQQYMLSMWQRTDGELFYPTFEYLIRTDRSIADIKEAWNTLQCWNPLLRTVFASTADSDFPLLQVVLKSELFRQERLPSKEPFANLQVANDHSEHGYRVKLHIHHSLYDAVSLPLLMQNLQGILNGTGVPHKDLTAGLVDFAAPSFIPQARQDSKKFWANYFRDATKVSHLARLSSQKPTKKIQIYDPAAFSACHALSKRARAANVSLQAILFAVVANNYARQASPIAPLEKPQSPPADTTTRRPDSAKHFHASAAEEPEAKATRARSPEYEDPDVVLGIYMSNRAEFPSLVAPTLNILPLRVRSPGSRSILDSARRIDEDLRSMAANVGVMMSSLQDVWEWTDGAARVDLFVNFLRLPQEEDGKDGELHVGAVVLDRNAEWEEERVGRVCEVGADKDAEVVMDGGVHSAYQHAVDVEFAIRDGGDVLSLGMFGWEHMVGLEDSETMVCGIMKGLEGVCGSYTEI